MKWRHLKTVAWLRWRLSVNQFKRRGILNAVVGAIWLLFALVVSAAAFLAALLIGLFPLADATPTERMFAWDAVILAFLVVWMIGLMADLQNGEVLSLEKLLHLPVSPAGAFVLNYFGSLVSITLAIFASAMIGLCIAQVFTTGVAMLVVPLLVVSFLFMVTAFTYQIRAWLFTLMIDRRRRRTVIAIMTLLFIAITQAPNLINLTVLRTERQQARALDQVAVTRLHELEQARQTGKINASEYAARHAELLRQQAEQKQKRRERKQQAVLAIALPLHLILPIGWLPYGVRAAAQGIILPALLGVVGASAVGVICLWLSYRSSVRLYTGVYSSKKRSVPDTSEQVRHPTQQLLLERRLPGISSQAATTTFATLRILLRAPEGKMLLLTPLFLLVPFGVMIFAGRQHHMSETIRPLLGLGAISIVVLSFGQLLTNIFAMDRAGFQSYILVPAARREILLGKNVAILLLGMVACAFMLLVVEIFVPMPLADLGATFLQFLSCFLVYCMIGNAISLWFPVALVPGSMKPKRVGFAAGLLQVLVSFMVPLVLLPAGIEWGAEQLLQMYFGIHLPVYLVLSAFELAVVLWFYRRVLAVEARLFDTHAQKVLETVTTPVE